MCVFARVSVSVRAWLHECVRTCVLLCCMYMARQCKPMQPALTSLPLKDCVCVRVRVCACVFVCMCEGL